MGFSRQDYWSGVPLPSLHFQAGNLNFLEFAPVLVGEKNTLECSKIGRIEGTCCAAGILHRNEKKPTLKEMWASQVALVVKNQET